MPTSPSCRRSRIALVPLVFLAVTACESEPLDLQPSTLSLVVVDPREVSLVFADTAERRVLVSNSAPGSWFPLVALSPRRTRICVESTTEYLVFDPQGRRLATFAPPGRLLGWIDEQRLVVHRDYTQGSPVVPDSPARLIIFDQFGTELRDLPLPSDARDLAIDGSIASLSPDGSRLLFSTPGRSGEPGFLRLHHVLDTADGAVIARSEGSMPDWVGQRDLVRFDGTRLLWHDDRLVVRNHRELPFSGWFGRPWQRHEVVVWRVPAGSLIADGRFRVSLDSEAPPSPLLPQKGAFAISPDLARMALVTGETGLALGRPDGSDARALLELPRAPIYLAW
jgi:hypothetical protein